jgi:hypothetical protein
VESAPKRTNIDVLEQRILALEKDLEAKVTSGIADAVKLVLCHNPD